MDQVLRGQEVAEVDKVKFPVLQLGKESLVLFMPIRHHSPACAYHVKGMIEQWEPDCVLIEGPENANRLIPVMVHQDTAAPFAIYYSYRDSKGYVSEEIEDYKCYYPFLDYSPELVALRESGKRNVPARFIDLPYGEILAASAEGKGLRRKDEKNNYNDDYLLARSQYMKLLCEKTGLRSFDELWEKYFEQNGLEEDTATFIGHMLAYCRQSRESTPEAELMAEGCLKREEGMAEKVREAAGEYRRILVVTGGFHTPGLIELLGEGKGKAEEEKKEKGKPKGRGKLKLKGIPEKDQGVYLMPYSMEASASLNGYASGIPFPGFYQQIWESLEGRAEYPYTEAVLNGIVSVGRAFRQKEGVVSSYDEICAFSMAQGLAALRNKSQPGAYDLYDSILSSFVKGEYNLSTDLPIRLLSAHLTGKGIGHLCAEAEIPPIVQDFDRQCKAFRLKTGSTLEQELVLEIFSSQKHREAGIFFARMLFLETGFCRKVKGPNLQLKRDRNLIREIWKYKWSAQVTAALIDVSVHGATVQEACISMVLSRLKKDCTAKEGAVLLTQVFEMGLDGQLDQVYGRVHQFLLDDGDFYSVAEALSYLVMLKELAGLYQAPMDLGALVGIGVRKLIALLPAMAQVKEEQLADCMKACKTLYQTIGQEDYAQDRENLYQALQELIGKREVNPGLDGCARGILYGAGQCSGADVEAACRGYLTGTHEQLLKSATFFRGLFYTARDLVFIGGGLIRTMDTLIGKLDNEEFMELLPEFRMAFGYFTPREIDQIAETAAGLHGKKKKDLLSLKEVTPEVYEYGRRLDGYAAGILNGLSYME